MTGDPAPSLSPAPPEPGVSPRRWQIPPIPVAVLLGLFLAILTVDAAFRDRGEFDYEILRLVHRIDFPGDARVMNAISDATSSHGAIGLWTVLVVSSLLLRRWLAATALFALPAAGAVNTAIRVTIGRTRPDPSAIDPMRDPVEVARILAANDFESFPSGHVAGAVLLWGLIFVFCATIQNTPIRLGIRSIAVFLIATVGLSRMWLGSHWASDVIGGYALGGFFLTAVVAAYLRLRPTMTDIPLIHAAPVPHPEGRPHAHALTSTLIFEDGRVYKMYDPGYIPRLIYWAAFQAPFGYAHNRLAVEAAVLRRNLAAKLTEGWFGTPRVAPAIGVGEVGGRLALIGQFTDGSEPKDHHRAREFLFDIAARFDRAGLPTWQIDPRQPRSLGNILENAAGEYIIIDLESGLVSPMASPRAWVRAIRRGLVPMYDDVFFDITRKYVIEDQGALRGSLGPEGYRDLVRLLDDAEAATAAWHASEPRIWSRIVRGIETGFGIRRWPARRRARAVAGQEQADAWIESAIDRWEQESRLRSGEADSLRRSLLAPDFQAVLPHFGVFLVIAVALRFPLGAITRVAYTSVNLLFAFVRFGLRRIDRHRLRRDMRIHSPLVILLAALPGFGTFAYLASGPVRSNHLLARIVLDAVGEKFPFHVYQRFGFKRIIARRPLTSDGPQPATIEPSS